MARLEVVAVAASDDDLIVAINEISQDDEDAGIDDDLLDVTDGFSYQESDDDDDDDDEDEAAIDLRRKVLENPCTFASIAQFLPVRDVVSVAQTRRSMLHAVLQLNSHWGCDRCDNPVFRGSGMPSSCQDKCRGKMCPKCTDRCDFCDEIKCFECELFICTSCDELVCADCEQATSCSCDHGNIYCPNCAETCEECNHPVTCAFCEATQCCCEVKVCSCCGDHRVCFDCKRTCSSCMRSQFVCPGCSTECPHCDGVHCMYCIIMGRWMM